MRGKRKTEMNGKGSVNDRTQEENEVDTRKIASREKREKREMREVELFARTFMTSVTASSSMTFFCLIMSVADMAMYRGNFWMNHRCCLFSYQQRAASETKDQTQISTNSSET